jgi:N,N'-diacetyllegionaminate synthase
LQKARDFPQECVGHASHESNSPAEQLESPRAVFELGINHMGDPARARRMLNVLAQAGATHATIQALVDPLAYSRNADAAEAVESFCIGLDEICALIHYGRTRGLTLGIAILDPPQVKPLVEAGAAFFKILSSDLTYAPLHRAVAQTGLPMYLSTGAAEIGDIEHARRLLRDSNPAADVRLIHTVLVIPTPRELLQLGNIPMLKARFNMPVAYGQHSDIQNALTDALVAGAESVFLYVAEERDPKLPDGPHAVLCSDVKQLLGDLKPSKSVVAPTARALGEKEKAARVPIRRSIVAARAICKGENIIEDVIAYKRPGTGKSPWEIGSVLGSVAQKDYAIHDDL